MNIELMRFKLELLYTFYMQLLWKFLFMPYVLKKLPFQNLVLL